MLLTLLTYMSTASTLPMGWRRLCFPHVAGAGPYTRFWQREQYTIRLKAAMYQ